LKPQVCLAAQTFGGLNDGDFCRFLESKRGSANDTAVAFTLLGRRESDLDELTLFK